MIWGRLAGHPPPYPPLIFRPLNGCKIPVFGAHGGRTRLWWGNAFLWGMLRTCASIIPRGGYPAELRGTPRHRLHALGHPVRWDEAAHAKGKPRSGTELRFEDVLPHPKHFTPEDQTFEYPMGLSPEGIAALLPVLRTLTHTPETTWLAFWDGTGKWDSAHFPNTFDDRTRADYADRCQQPEAFARSIRSLPRWAHPGWGPTGRNFWLAHGPLTAAWDVARSIYRAEPNFWWPEDHAWCLVWEIDFDFSLIGTTTVGAIRLLALPEVETALLSTEPEEWREF